MSNDNTIPSVTGFIGGGTADYIAPANNMTGAAGGFAAAALFRIRNDESEGVIWGNEDNGSGWAIVMAEDGVLTARVRDNTGALIEASVQLGPVADPAQGAGMYIDRWILAHLVKAESQLHLYVNGVLVATTAMPNPANPSFGNARVGNDTSGGEVGDSMFIGGVAYLNEEMDSEIVAEHFTSCVMSRSMAPLLLSLGQSSAAGDFTNRWTAGDLVDPAFPVGTLGVDSGGNKALIAGPPGAQLWQPRAGTVVLIKEVQDPPGPGQQPIMFSVKNVPWYGASAGAGGGGGGGACGPTEFEAINQDNDTVIGQPLAFETQYNINNDGVSPIGNIEMELPAILEADIGRCIWLYTCYLNDPMDTDNFGHGVVKAVEGANAIKLNGDDTSQIDLFVQDDSIKLYHDGEDTWYLGN